MQAWMVLETDLPSGGCGAGLGSWAGVFLVTWGFTVVPRPVVVRLSWRCWKAPRFDVSKFFQGVLAGLSLGFFWGCRQGWMELWADLLPGAWMLLRGVLQQTFPAESHQRLGGVRVIFPDRWPTWLLQFQEGFPLGWLDEHWPVRML